MPCGGNGTLTAVFGDLTDRALVLSIVDDADGTPSQGNTRMAHHLTESRQVTDVLRDLAVTCSTQSPSRRSILAAAATTVWTAMRTDAGVAAPRTTEHRPVSRL